METRKIINLALVFSWVLIVALLLLVLLRERLPDVGSWLASLGRTEQPPARIFPRADVSGMVISFRDPDDLRFWRTREARADTASDVYRVGDRWARVIYFPTTSPSFLFDDEQTGVMDWRGVENFSFRVFNPQGWPVGLKVKVKDTADNFFQRDLDLPPSRTLTVSIPVANISRQLDVSRINYLNLFLWEPATETRLFFTDFKFLPPGAEPESAAAVSFSGMEFPPEVLSGQELEGSFYFTPSARIESDWDLLVRLTGGGGVYELGRFEIPFPTSRWPVGRRTMVGPLPLTVPETLAPGSYELEVILFRAPEPAAGRRPVFKSYRNPEIAGHRVATIRVTGAASGVIMD